MAKGFNRPKGMGGAGGGGGMMSQLKKLQEQMEQTQAQLAEETVTATVGGGAIKVTMTGDQRCKGITIDPKTTCRPCNRNISLYVGLPVDGVGHKH